MYRFSNQSLEHRLNDMFGAFLKMQDAVSLVINDLATLQARTKEILEYCQSEWQPLGPQKKMLKALVAHYLVKPLDTYENIADRVGGYIQFRAATFCLGVYVNNKLCRMIVDDYLAVQSSELKSALCKQIIESVTGKKVRPLTIFAQAMLNKYHLPRIPNPPPRAILAAFAMLREIAYKKTPQEKKFWTLIEKELSKLYKANGAKREDPRWHKWEDAIITKDNALFNGGSDGGAGALSAAAVDAALFENGQVTMLPDELEPGGIGENQGGVEHTEESEDGVDRPRFNPMLHRMMGVDFQPGHEDGDVDITLLGDVASDIDERLRSQYM
ncbi:hypothetical protein CERSUDRAFT_101019 [Gelatoporia subvermispora B]|uniref:Uncharacterized protein n=1 Tax=Ceriporiopsis subvermispora (strain B) TaxID=914234 RepID=M2QXT4_CERS8|nr:hypothetical protein CERSUDRAFT_101019 [Gelatoporia subvermispora B]